MSDLDSALVLSRPAFAVSNHTFVWREVLLAAQAWGTWGECEQAARDGLARLAAAEQGDAALGEDELRESERAFRAAHGLLSGEELETWLSRWQLDARAWRDYIHADALRGPGVDALRAPHAGAMRDAAGARPAAAGDAVDPAVLARATWAHAVCSGALEQVLHRLAGVVAAADARGASLSDTEELDETVLAELYELYEGFCERALSARAIEREVELRALDWTRFELCYIAADEEAVMREAALCVREDGMSIEEVGASAGIAVQRLACELASLEGELRSELLGSRTGAMLGPVLVDGTWRLVEVLERRSPSLSDPALRERAAKVAVDGAVQAEVMNRVRWA